MIFVVYAMTVTFVHFQLHLFEQKCSEVKQRYTSFQIAKERMLLRDLERNLIESNDIRREDINATTVVIRGIRRGLTNHQVKVMI